MTPAQQKVVISCRNLGAGKTALGKGPMKGAGVIPQDAAGLLRHQQVARLEIIVREIARA
jgi:hypothetical protein